MVLVEPDTVAQLALQTSNLTASRKEEWFGITGFSLFYLLIGICCKMTSHG